MSSGRIFEKIWTDSTNLFKIALVSLFLIFACDVSWRNLDCMLV